jgi:hypothetical protein
LQSSPLPSYHVPFRLKYLPQHSILEPSQPILKLSIPCIFYKLRLQYTNKMHIRNKAYV